MKELRCPKCGNVFKVDEADYATILNQVKNAEFEAELERRMKEVEARHQTEQELEAAKDAEDLTIRKLTHKNPTMKQKFDEARARNSQEPTDEL